MTFHILFPEYYSQRKWLPLIFISKFSSISLIHYQTSYWWSSISIRNKRIFYSCVYIYKPTRYRSSLNFKIQFWIWGILKYVCWDDWHCMDLCAKLSLLLILYSSRIFNCIRWYRLLYLKKLQIVLASAVQLYF